MCARARRPAPGLDDADADAAHLRSPARLAAVDFRARGARVCPCAAISQQSDAAAPYPCDSDAEEAANAPHASSCLCENGGYHDGGG